MVGRLRSMALILLSIIFGMLTQYYWADTLANRFSRLGDGCGRPILPVWVI